MSKKTKIMKGKKDTTVVDSLIAHSKELLEIRNVTYLIKELIFRIAKGKYNPIESKQTNTKSLLKEFEFRAIELEEHMCNLLKQTYSNQYVLRFSRFHLSSAEMQAGYTSFTVYRNNESRRMILFLSDTTPDFLETIPAGSLVEWDKSLEETYLSRCKSVWKPNSFLDMHFQRLNSIMK